MPINDDLTPEQLAELEELRAERATPEARAEEERLRAAILAERATPEGRAQELRAVAAIEAESGPAGDPGAAEALVRLRLARERLGLSLTDISERTKIDRGTLSKLERGQGNPTLGTLYRIAGAMGLKLDWSLVEAGATDRG